MYLEHFGLTEPPFRITPHTDFFFDGANRGATLDALLYAITHDEGIVKISGEVGSGKTMLCRVLMERLPEKVTIIYLANPSLAREDILYAIADELHLPLPDNARVSLVLRTLQDHLITSFSEGRQVVVLIDEAHAMPVETLEEIRLLSNLEANRHKLLQLVLFGQPELNDILARPDMRQLKERITHNFGLEPLVREDIASYLDFRMRAAGYRGPSVFTPVAVKMIARTSHGLTRRINILADKALLAAYAKGSHQIGAKEAHAAIRDSEFSQATYAGKRTPKHLTRTIALGGAATAVVVASVATTWLIATTQRPILRAAEPVLRSAPPASQASRTTPAPPAPNKTPVYPLTQARIAAGQHWLEKAPNDHWFIQIWATDATQQEQVESFLNAAAPQADFNNLRVYFSPLSGQPRYGIIYGEYPTRATAVAAIKQLPDILKKTKPYARQVSRLRQ
ncbi:MAG: AAA family ATPase [Rugosibacter sp.]|nr:MAG: AAA family ATPase [Rugosibacter sp.]TBR09269.1 MAG: AAA family ATPase [Rugosibacter sp.]